MNLFLLFNQASTILISFFSIFLAFWVYFTNKRSKLNKFFFWFAIFLFLWIIFCYFGNTSSTFIFASLFGKLAYGVVALFFIPFYYFSLTFLKEKNKYPFFNIFVVVSSLFIFLLSVFTDLMVANMEFTKFGAIPVLGKGKFIYLAIILIFILFIISRFLVNYFKFSKEKKLKLQYFLMGLFAWLIMNLIFNVIFPFLQKAPQFWALGNYSAIFLLSFTVYAIVKRELFGMRVVLTSIFAGLITVLLVIDTVFLTPVFLHQLFKLLLLIIFIYFGYRLIKSVLDEIQKRKELEDLTLRLEKANIELRKLDKAKSEFLSIASHQLRTPLTAIKGYISMILDGDYGKMNSKIEKTVQNIYNSNERLVKLVNNLLNVSKIESGKIKMNFEEIQLEDVISETVSELKIKAEEKKLKIHWNKPKSAWPLVSADRSRIKQVFLNVVDNAIKYTKKGSISIKIDIQDEKYIIEISDTGCGVPKEDFHRLFYSFTRGETGFLDHTEGAGLGLYIAKKFVEAHKGKIWVESQGRNKGSTFYIELPIKK